MVAQTGAAAEVTTPAKEGTVTTAELTDLVKNGTPLVLLDARTGKYDDGRRIPGAKALAPDATREAVEALVPDKGAVIVTYCANLKCPASAKLATHLGELGYTNVRHYPDGIEGWAAAGQPIVTVEKVPAEAK